MNQASLDISQTSVSVIIPAFNAKATIDRALASVAAQTVMPQEIIVIDDGSDDGTVDKAKAWESRFSNSKLIILVENHNGPGATRNRGLLAATSEYVAFLDADDEWLPKKLERSLTALIESDRTILSHNYTIISGDQTNLVDCFASYQKSDNAFAGYFLRGYIATSTVVAQRNLLIDAGGFDPGLPSGQDYEFWMVVIDSPKARYQMLNVSLARYHVTPNSISSKIELRRQCALDIAFRHAYRLRDRCRFPTWVLMLRILIIHAQAAIGHISRSRFNEAIKMCGYTIIALFSMMRKFSTSAVPRPQHLHIGHDGHK